MKSELLAKLRAANITQVIAQYSGSGDEGFINEVTTIGAVVNSDVHQDLEIFFWDYVLENSHAAGFHNDDGGYGTITWDITTDKITVDHTAYYTEERSFPPEVVEFEDEDEE